MTRPVIEPRGLQRDNAALYVGISPSKFDQLVEDGRMPRPKRIDRRVLWDRHELDAAFSDLAHDEPVNPWDLAFDVVKPNKPS